MKMNAVLITDSPESVAADLWRSARNLGSGGLIDTVLAQFTVPINANRRKWLKYKRLRRGQKHERRGRDSFLPRCCIFRLARGLRSTRVQIRIYAIPAGASHCQL